MDVGDEGEVKDEFRILVYFVEWMGVEFSENVGKLYGYGWNL